MTRFTAILAILTIILIPRITCSAILATGNTALEMGFMRPPDSAKPQVWWHWMNGNISKEGIHADLEAMKHVGIGGATIVNADCGIPAGPVKYGTQEWYAMVKYAISEATRLGLDLCLENCAGWSSSGGPWNTPEHAMQFTTISETSVKGPVTFSGKLVQPTTKLNFYRDIAVLAIPKPDGKESRFEGLGGKAAYERVDSSLQTELNPDTTGAIPVNNIINLTTKMQADGTLNWQAPAGDWVILRIGHTPTGKENHPAPAEGTGPECDKLSAEAARAHWAGMMGKVIQDAGAMVGKGLTTTLIDSYEVHSQNWTEKFAQEFKARRGYDITPWLVTLTGRVVQSPEYTERFLWDFRRTICELFTQNYAGEFAKMSHESGIKLAIEPYGDGVFEDFSYGGAADIPMGEFWSGGGAEGTTKLAASIAHTYGRKYVAAESFTAEESKGRWQNDPASLKALGDQVYCMGINRFVFHRYAHQPWLNRLPGMTMGPWGFHFERTITWWDQSQAWLSYLARCQYMLQEGQFVADALYFNGESQPVSMRAGDPALPKGYDYDACSREIVMNSLSVKDGRLVLASGMSYRVLILPPDRVMTLPLLQKLQQLVKDGAIIIGPMPLHTPGLEGFPQSDTEMKTITAALWGDCNGTTVTSHTYGKGRIIWGQKMDVVFSALNLKPDFESGTAKIPFIHRQKDNADYYFLCNPAGRSVIADLLFRMSGKTAELWNPQTGVRRVAPMAVDSDVRTRISLTLPANGSVFVVFQHKRDNTRQIAGANFTSTSKVVKLDVPEPKLEVIHAVYEALDGAGSADVTKTLQNLVENNTLSFTAGNELQGDPANLHLKQLKLEYRYGGKTKNLVVAENAYVTLPEGLASGMPDWVLHTDEKGKTYASIAKSGKLDIQTTNGKKQSIKATVLAPQVVTGAWDLSFPPKLGAPAHITLDNLISWPDHSDAGVKYFSGTAVYTRDLVIPQELIKKHCSLILDLGNVKNFAQVLLNGKDLGVLWMPPFQVDIAAAAHKGANKLEIRVTNLWVNRLIGDDFLPEDCEWNGKQLAKWPQWVLDGKPSPSGKLTFTTWKHWTKTDLPLESGLIGPVMLRPVVNISVK